MMFLNNLDIFDYLLNKKRSGGGDQLVKVTDAKGLFSKPDNIAITDQYSTCLQKYMGICDFSECTDFSFMFYQSKNVTDLRDFDLSRATNIDRIFYSCVNLKYIPEKINFEKIVELGYSFHNCSLVENMPKDLYIPECTTLDSTFRSCTQIEEINFHRTTTKVRSAASLFNGCIALRKIKGLELPLCSGGNTAMWYMLYNTCELEELEMFNITGDLTIGSGTSWGHKLTLDSLVHTIKELVNYRYGSRTLTVGSANLEKLSNVYVKLTEELDLDNRPKVPFEICESTDEGAILITEYALLKNWQIQ